jgi:hypothetical protein
MKYNQIAAQRVRCLFGLAATAAMLWALPVSAQYVTVYGGPTYSFGVGGFQNGGGGNATDAGAALASAEEYVGAEDLGYRSFRLNAFGPSPVELQPLSPGPAGITDVVVGAMNAAGVSVGYSHAFSGGTDEGTRAVRWSISGEVSELDNLGTDNNGFTDVDAFAINTSGVAAGYGNKYQSGVFMGLRAIRWDAAGTAATELGSLGPNSSGLASADALAINDSGVIAGASSGSFTGQRAVRWDPGNLTPVLLGSDVGVTSSNSAHINSAGTIVGEWQRTDDKGNGLGTRAVRWDSSGAATELQSLWSDQNGSAQNSPRAINDAGVVVGGTTKFVSGANKGDRAVRWDASGSAATELGSLGTNSSGLAQCVADDINNSGIAVGTATRTNASDALVETAVMWGPDGVAVDLNSFVDPSSGWMLSEATSISDNGWIAGWGDFYPDGPGGASYERGFLLHIPEPQSISLIVACALSVVFRRRIHRR